MSQHDVSTKHRTEDGEQITTKTVTVDGVEYPFEGEPGGEYEAVGGANTVAYEALLEHLGEGETLIDEAGEEFTPVATSTETSKSGGSSEE